MRQLHEGRIYTFWVVMTVTAQPAFQRTEDQQVIPRGTTVEIDFMSMEQAKTIALLYFLDFIYIYPSKVVFAHSFDFEWFEQLNVLPIFKQSGWVEDF